MHDAKTTRYWTEKCAPPLLAILGKIRSATEGHDLNEKLRTEDGLALLLEIENFFLWPFYSTKIPEPARINDGRKELALKLTRAGQKIEQTTTDYISTTHCGILFWPDKLTGEARPECPVTVKGEQAALRLLQKQTESFYRTRNSRKDASARKILHTNIALFAILFGALPGTKNQFTIETLSWEETAELFDSFCPPCKTHTPEQARKICQRIITTILEPIQELLTQERLAVA